VRSHARFLLVWIDCFDFIQVKIVLEHDSSVLEHPWLPVSPEFGFSPSRELHHVPQGLNDLFSSVTRLQAFSLASSDQSLAVVGSLQNDPEVL
jgi:hypothetical protein